MILMAKVENKVRQEEGADDLAAQVVKAVSQLVVPGTSVVITTDAEDGKTVVKIEPVEQPKPDATMVRIETPNGHLDLEPQDPLAQAKRALEDASVHIAALKAL